jgi:hypothetical protein
LRNAFILASVLIIAGCAQQGYPGSQAGYQAPPIQEVPKVVQVNDDKFSKTITLVGYEQVQRVHPQGGDSFIHQLRSWINRDTGEVTHQIYVSQVYGGTGWRHWNRANDQTANPMEFNSINKKVGSCSGRGAGCVHTETFGIDVGDVALKNALTTGYMFKIYSQSGEERVLILSADQISKQLDAVAEKLFAGKQAGIDAAPPQMTPPPTDIPHYQAPEPIAPPPGTTHYPQEEIEAKENVDDRPQSYPSGVFPPAQRPTQLTPQNNGSVAYPAPVRTY